MSRNNFGRAMNDMFGVGKDEAAQPETNETITMEEPTGIRNAGNEATYFGVGSSMEGTLKTKGDVEIAGDFKGEIVSGGKVVLHAGVKSTITTVDLFLVGCKLEGNVTATGRVVIDENSTLNGNISAAEITCSGKVRGDVDVTGNLSLSERAQIVGGMKVGTMSIACGAKISGNIETKGMDAKKA